MLRCGREACLFGPLPSYSLHMVLRRGIVLYLAAKLQRHGPASRDIDKLHTHLDGKGRYEIGRSVSCDRSKVAQAGSSKSTSHATCTLPFAAKFSFVACGIYGRRMNVRQADTELFSIMCLSSKQSRQVTTQDHDVSNQRSIETFPKWAASGGLPVQMMV